MLHYCVSDLAALCDPSEQCYKASRGMQVFRAWTQNTDELVLHRPHKLLRPLLVSQYPGCRPCALPSGADLLVGPPLSAMCGQGGKWGEELQPLFVSRVTPSIAQGRMFSM